MPTIREDIVSIGFEVEDNPFKEITDGIDEMRAAVAGGVGDSVEDLKQIAKEAGKAADGVDELTRSVKKTSDSKGLTDMVRSVKDLAKVKIGDGLDKLKSIPTKAKSGFDNLLKSANKLKNIKLSDVGKGIDKALGKGVTASGKLFTSLKKAAGVGFQKTVSGIKSIATQAGKATVAIGKGLATGVGVGVGAAATAVGGLVTKSVQAYADFEQLTGGVETLFKDSAPTVQKYANNAYKTAGLSANEYMETVTSFSASLLQSVGGDTEKAASYADMAITDMSDNANKMGTDMESIQNAYQGFAKQNYTMLDNLKLGYGGTKEEMQRLVKYAAKVDSSIDANSLSYANVVKAIHAVQDNMGITGTTALEAEKTISGSIAGMKSAWGNLLTSLAQGGGNLDQNIANLVQSVKTVATNIMPVAKSALTGVVTLIQELLPVVLAEIPSLISQVLPQVANAGMQLMQVLLNTISSNASMIGSGAMQLVSKFAQFIIGALPQIVSTGMRLILSLVNGISQQLPTLIPMAIRAITTLIQGLVSMLPQIISAGIRLISSLVRGVANALPQLIPAGVKAIVSLIQGITGAIPQLLSAGLKLIPVVLKAIITNLPQILEGGIKIIVSLVKGLGQAIPQLIEFLPKIAKTIIDTLKEIDLLEVGKNIVQGLIKGISSMLGAVKDAAKNVAKGAANAIKGFLGIKSPSRLMIEQGEYTGEGLALGIKGMTGEVEKAAIGLSMPIAPAVNKYTPSGSSVSTTNNNNRSVVNNYSPQFTLNMNGASATEANKRKVKKWVKESMQEMFESMGRTNPELCEV